MISQTYLAGTPVVPVSSPPSPPATAGTALSAAPADGFERGVTPSPGEAVVLIPAGKGAFDAIHKIPCDDPRSVITTRDRSGTPVRIMASGEGSSTYVSCLAPDGSQRWRVPVPAGERVAVGGIVADDERGRVLVRTGRMLLALDTGSGLEGARRDFGELNFCRCLVVRSSGEIDVTEDERLLRLDADLRDVSSEQLGMRVEQLRELEDGSLFLFADNCPAHLVVVGPDGQRRLDEHYAGLHSTTVDEHGNIWAVDDKDIGTVVDHKQKNVVRYNAADGTVTRFPATNEAEGIVPRRDGSCMVFHDELTKPAFVLFDAEGKRCGGYRFDREGFARQVWLGADQRQVYVVLDSYESGDSNKPCDQLLYQFEMPEPGKEASSALGRLFPSLQDKRLEPIHVHTNWPRTGGGGGKGIMPAGLSDGRVVVFKEGEILVLEPDGKVQASYPGDLAALVKGLDGAEFVTRRVQLDHTQAEGLESGSRSVLEAACRQFGYPPVPEMTAALQPGDVDPADGCVSYPARVDGEQVKAGEGAVDPETLQRMLLEGRLLDFALHDEIEMRFPNGGGTVVMKPEAAHMRVDDGSGTIVESVRSLPDGCMYTSALPVMVGQKPFLAAGTSDGRLVWIDARDARWNSEPHAFAVGTPVQRIDIQGDMLRALGNDGRVLLFRPSEAGTLQAVPSPSAAGPAGEGTPLAGGVVVEKDRVVIGGVAIARRA